MQLSIPSFILGSPTLYKIIASADSGVVEIDKRFNDFIQLADDFAQEMDEPVPIPPPSKKWFGGNDAATCEQRRKDLELMMRALVRNPEYLRSLAVQKFLNLSRKETSPNSDWLQISSRVGDLISQAKSIQAPAQKRKLCLEAKSYVTQLQKQLSAASSEVGAGEQTRRATMVEGFLSSINQLELQVLTNLQRDTGHEPGRQPFTATSGRVLGETEVTRKLNNTELLDHQRGAVGDQDKQLEQLRIAISRQKELGLAIDDELTKQNAMLEQLDSQVHGVNAKVNQAKRKTSKLN